MMTLTEVITKQARFDEVLAIPGGTLVVFKFTAEWCGPCRKIQPFYEEFASKHRDVIFCIVDVDKSPDISAKCEISAMPTFVFFKNQTEVHRFSGASQEKLKELVERLK